MNTQTDIPEAVLRTAVHEAGHAVAAFVLKLPLLGVSLEKGCCGIETPETEPNQRAELANSIAIYALAGPEAERVFTGVDPADGAVIDQALAKGVLEDWLPETKEPQEQAIQAKLALESRRDQAADLVRQNWPQVLALAITTSREPETLLLLAYPLRKRLAACKGHLWTGTAV